MSCTGCRKNTHSNRKNYPSMNVSNNTSNSRRYSNSRNYPSVHGSNKNPRYINSTTYRPTMCPSNPTCRYAPQVAWHTRANRPTFLDYKVNGSHGARTKCPSTCPPKCSYYH